MTELWGSFALQGIFPTPPLSAQMGEAALGLRLGPGREGSGGLAVLSVSEQGGGTEEGGGTEGGWLVLAPPQLCVCLHLF